MIEHEIPAGVRPMAAEKYVRRAWPMLPGRAVRQLFERRDVKRGGARLGAGDAVGAIVGAAVGSGALDQQPVHMDMAAIAAITINMRFIEYASLTIFIDELFMCGWAQKNAPIGTFFC